MRIRGVHRNLSHTRIHKGPDDVIPTPAAPPFADNHTKHIVKFQRFKMFLQDPETEAGHTTAGPRRSSWTRPFCRIRATLQLRFKAFVSCSLLFDSIREAVLFAALCGCSRGSSALSRWHGQITTPVRGKIMSQFISCQPWKHQIAGESYVVLRFNNGHINRTGGHKRKAYLDHLTCSGVELDELRLLDSPALVLWLCPEPSGIKRSVQCWRSDLISSSALTVWTQDELFPGFERFHRCQHSCDVVSSSLDHTDTDAEGELRQQWTFVPLWRPDRMEDGAASHHAHQWDSSASTCGNWNGDIISARCTGA